MRYHPLRREMDKQTSVLGLPWWSTGTTLHSQHRGPGVDPWLGDWIPHVATESSHAATKDPLHHN